MEISDVTELQYITPIANLPSILKHGILSHRRVEKIAHESVAMEEIQELRALVRIPNGGPLHEYANLYFNARNTMMYKRSSHHRTFCVLRIRPDVLQLGGVVITDRNAASNWVRWGSYPEALARIDRDRIFAERWDRHEEPIDRLRHRSEMCAETLVPDRVAPEYIKGVYASCSASAEAARQLTPNLPVTVNGYIFFFTSLGRPQ